MLQSRAGSFDAAQFSRDDYHQYITVKTVATDGFQTNDDEYHRDGRGRDGKLYSNKRGLLVGVSDHRYLQQAGRHGNGRRDEMVTPAGGIHYSYDYKPKQQQAYQRSVSENRSSRAKERSHSKERKRSVSPQIERKTALEPVTTSINIQVVRKQKVMKKHNKREHRFDYLLYDVRVESFFLKPSWPKHEMLIALLASHGFYFTGHEDIVECHVCRVRIEGWSVNDDPLLRHLESEPNCQFIREQYQFSIEEICSQKFELYKSLKNREKSFKYWPIPGIVDIRELVDAGWFYTGKDDITQCFTCGCRNDEWKKGDDPIAVHSKLSRNCSFLMRQKSSSKVVIDFSKEESRLQSFKHYPKKSKVLVDDLVKSGFHLLSLDPVVKVKCYSCELVAEVEWMEGKGPAGLHIKMSPDCPVAQDNEDTASLPGPIMSRRQLQNIYLYKSRGESEEKVQESLPAPNVLRKSSTPHTPPTPYSLPNMHHASSPASTHELTRSRSFPEEDKLCVVCLDNTKQYAIVPCGHLCVCHDCSQHLVLCPICRIKKEDILRIYNS